MMDRLEERMINVFKMIFCSNTYNVTENNQLNELHIIIWSDKVKWVKIGRVLLCTIEGINAENEYRKVLTEASNGRSWDDIINCIFIKNGMNICSRILCFFLTEKSVNLVG
jgi:hypothetical protein